MPHRGRREQRGEVTIFLGPLQGPEAGPRGGAGPWPLLGSTWNKVMPWSSRSPCHRQREKHWLFSSLPGSKGVWEM